MALQIWTHFFIAGFSLTSNLTQKYKNCFSFRGSILDLTFFRDKEPHVLNKKTYNYEHGMNARISILTLFQTLRLFRTNSVTFI